MDVPRREHAPAERLKMWRELLGPGCPEDAALVYVPRPDGVDTAMRYLIRAFGQEAAQDALAEFQRAQQEPLRALLLEVLEQLEYYEDEGSDVAKVLDHNLDPREWEDPWRFRVRKALGL